MSDGRTITQKEKVRRWNYIFGQQHVFRMPGIQISSSNNNVSYLLLHGQVGAQGQVGNKGQCLLRGVFSHTTTCFKSKITKTTQSAIDRRSCNSGFFCCSSIIHIRSRFGLGLGFGQFLFFEGFGLFQLFLFCGSLEATLQFGGMQGVVNL